MAVSARQKVFLIGILLFVASYGLLSGTSKSWISVFAAFVTGVPAILSIHIATQACSKKTTLKELIQLYFFGLMFLFYGKHQWKKFKEATKTPREIQEKLLLEILQKNAETEYGRTMGLGYAFTVDDFRKRHPLSKYDQFEDYIKRTAKGEDNVLLPSRPVQFVMTSGTTGKPKMIPMSTERKQHISMTGFTTLMGIVGEEIPSKSLTQKMCSIYTHPAETWSEAGIVKCAFTRITKNDILPVFVSPAPGFRICTEKEAMYVHAIFALKDEYLNTLQAPFCIIICNFFKVIENNWSDMVNDIATGTIKTDLDIPSDVRSELNEILTPDPIRAEQLRREFERGFEGIARRVWPYMSCLFGVVTPAFKFYADLLENKYAKDVVLYTAFYISSEGVLGLNVWPKIPERKLHYLLFTDLTFFEFIPLEKSQEEQPETLLIDELKEDESYELVLTNIDGLYRFRFGDVIKVVGFYNKSPIIEIQFRIGDLINLRGEKMSEDCLRRALLDTVESWEADLVDYACAECSLVEAVKGATETADVPYYVMFVEIQSKPGSIIKKEELLDKDKFDIILRNQVPMYDYYRGMGSLGLAQVILVQSGSFNELRDYIIHNSTTSILQFKMPRKLRKNEWVKLLLKNSS
ncbi:uncharacterized protein [Amphiura filiformis]|uniref:uncharacterized protein n=1 Tax=Amphiura filiformis TaxID=82378 RepID=UPI003B21D99A